MNYPLKNGIMMTKEEKIEFLEKEIVNLEAACKERAQERDYCCDASLEWQKLFDQTRNEAVQMRYAMTAHQGEFYQLLHDYDALKHKMENLESSNLSLKEEAMLYFNLSEKADQKRVEVWIMLPINHREVELDWGRASPSGRYPYRTHLGPVTP